MFRLVGERATAATGRRSGHCLMEKDTLDESISLHVLCRIKGIAPHGVTQVEKGQYQSVSWRFHAGHIPGLIGRPICFHEVKSKPSYFGGTITRIDREPVADNDGDVRSIVYFTSDGTGTGLKWAGNQQSREVFHVNKSVPLAELKP